ncbi:MAG: sulfatase-like hydrolase/transferase, partial [Chloroflexi bacterium]|nr:sulfatase-like hydrolase/transferase [Chloroflexota bacterium]
YLDTHVGDLIAELKKKGLYDQALIVFTADHGEEFYEHQGWGHGRTVYQEVIQVPLIVKYPGGWGAGTVDEHLVRSIDLAPTILDTAGIRPPATMQGVSLLQPAPPADEQVAFSETDFEGNVARAWVTPRDKLIQVVDGDPRGREAIQLYDLAADPGETLNLAQAHVGVVADLRRQMDRLMIAALEASVAGTEFEIDPETEQRLKLLGY